MSFNGQEVTKAKYREALALPQTYTIRQGFVSGLVMGTIYGEICLVNFKLACCSCLTTEMLVTLGSCLVWLWILFPDQLT
jgi:hypothetical protein